MDIHLVLATTVALTVASMAGAVALTAARTGAAEDRRRVLSALLQIALMGWAAVLALLGRAG